MTGLLARLAARAAGEAPVAGPRIPSRFEALPEEIGLPEPAAAADAGAHGEAAGPVQPSGAQGMPLSSAPMPPTPLVIPVSPAAPIEAAPIVTPSLAVAPAAGAMPVAAAPLPAAAVQRREMSAAPLAAESAAATSPVVPDAAVQSGTELSVAPLWIEVPGTPFSATRPRSASANPFTPSAPDPAPLQRADPALEPRRTAPAQRPAIVTPAPAMALEGPSATAARADPAAPAASPVPAHQQTSAATPAVFTPEISRVVPRPPVILPLPSAPAPPPEAAAPPVVEIHIGHIEVRAAAAPVAPAPPPASAKLSLDAFLAQGNDR